MCPPRGLPVRYPSRYSVMYMVLIHIQLVSCFTRSVLSASSMSCHSNRVLAGNPRRLMEDDVFHGYHLPKGATIVFNAWSEPSLYQSRRDLTQCLSGLCRATQASIPSQMFSSLSDSSLRAVAYPTYTTQRSSFSASDVGEHGFCY